MEANAQLGLVKLPEKAFGQYKNMIKRVLYDQLKEGKYGGDEPRIEARKEEINKEN